MDLAGADQGSMSPQQVAERLTDVAYALVAGRPLELTLGHERVTVPLGDVIRLERDLRSDGDRHRLVLDLSWSTSPPSRGRRAEPSP